MEEEAKAKMASDAAKEAKKLAAAKKEEVFGHPAPVKTADQVAAEELAKSKPVPIPNKAPKLKLRRLSLLNKLN